MKQTSILLLFLIFCLTSFSQLGRHGDNGNSDSVKTKAKIIRNAKMANTTTMTPTNTTNTSNTDAASTTTVNTNTTTQQPATTIDELNQRINDLQQQLKMLQDKISFSDFNIIRYTVQKGDLQPTGNTSVQFKPLVRINHPLCNNRPDIKLFVQSAQGLNVSTYYSDGYWYIKTPFLYSESIMQYGLTDYANIGGYMGTMLNKNVDFDYVVKNGGVMRANYYSPNYGEAFTILVFKDLPNYNPAIYQK